MKKLVGKNKGYVVVTSDDLQGAKSAEELYGGLKRVVDENPNKKIIIVAPLSRKGLSLKARGWMSGEGGKYFAHLIKNYPNEYDAVKHWIETRGVDGKLKGPSPESAARGYEKTAHQLEQEVKMIAGDRPTITGFVGHSFEIITYLAYLAGNGKIDLESLEAVSSGKGSINETEKATITIRPDETTIDYRGKKSIQHDLEDIVGMLALGGAFLSLLFSFSGINNLTGNVIGTTGNTSNLSLVFALLALICGSLWLLLRKKKTNKK